MLCVLGQTVEREDDRSVIWVGDEMPQKVQPRVRYLVRETPLQEGALVRQIAWSTAMRPLEIRAAPGWEAMGRQIEEGRETVHLIVSEVADWGLHAFRNARKNWKRTFRSLAGLRGRLTDVPAIICGAGPSLQEAPLAALGERAVLFAAGTALPLLGRQGIEPHFACALDKTTPPEPLWQQPFGGVPLLFQSRLAPACLDPFYGEKILAPESGPLPWEEWWLEQERMEFGWTVGNFATQAAVWMGCNPIVWTGMDLCYREGRKYAYDQEQKATPLIEMQNRQGQPIWTQRDWVQAARWHEQLVRANPAVRFINTAPDGLPVDVETRAWAELSFPLQRDVRGRVHQAIQQAPRIAVKPKEAEWEASRVRCLAVCLAMEESDLTGEPVYDYYLEPLWRIWQPLLAREAEGQNIEWHRLVFFQQVLQNLCDE